mgnify:CR=1 FL=1
MDAWDCDLFTTVTIEPYDLGIDYEDDDYQILALDRFYDRLITDSLDGRGEKELERCW